MRWELKVGFQALMGAPKANFLASRKSFPKKKLFASYKHTGKTIGLI